jgi:hypothetical protein
MRFDPRELLAQLLIAYCTAATALECVFIVAMVYALA